jgi:hypothetical protein
MSDRWHGHIEDGRRERQRDQCILAVPVAESLWLAMTVLIAAR